MRRTALLAAICLGSTALSAPGAKRTQSTATIDSGVIVGTTALIQDAGASVNKFLGIPYAAPPVRFSPPERPQPWSTPLDATAYRAPCIQVFDYPKDFHDRTIEWFDTPPPPAAESEDCLNLNVYAPASAKPGSKAVLFWIHGGDFVFGSGSLPEYDGSNLAANQDVVVVTINYRTNVFGYPGSPDIPDSEKNLGWLDQRLALDWVQRNIATLGGDPDRVTIIGQSAGGGSVDALVTAPPDPVPFAGAIMQSGQATIYIPETSSAESWETLTETFNCTSGDGLECMRAVPATRLKQVMEVKKLGFNPVKDDGVTWAERPRLDRGLSVLDRDRIARVPIMIGTNADEGKTFAYGQNDTAEFIHDTLHTFSKIELLTLTLVFNFAYPIGSPGISNQYDQISAILGESSFQCPAKDVARESRLAGIPTWRYFYNATFPNTQIFPDSGAYHSSEIYSLFGTYPQEGKTHFQDELSCSMQKAWADFAKNPKGGPGWTEAPFVGVLGNYRGEQETIVTESPSYIDRRCKLYEALYDLASVLT